MCHLASTRSMLNSVPCGGMIRAMSSPFSAASFWHICDQSAGLSLAGWQSAISAGVSQRDPLVGGRLAVSLHGAAVGRAAGAALLGRRCGGVGGKAPYARPMSAGTGGADAGVSGLGCLDRTPRPAGTLVAMCLARATVLWIGWGAMAFDWHAAAHCRHPVVMRATGRWSVWAIA